MPYASKRNRSKEREMEAAASNRRKIIATRLSGRDLMRMVLLIFIPPIAQPVASLTPAPTVAPNPPSGERRARDHQAITQLSPQKFYEFHQREALVSAHPEFPLQ